MKKITEPTKPIFVLGEDNPNSKGFETIHWERGIVFDFSKSHNPKLQEEVIKVGGDLESSFIVLHTEKENNCIVPTYSVSAMRFVGEQLTGKEIKFKTPSDVSIVAKFLRKTTIPNAE